MVFKRTKLLFHSLFSSWFVRPAGVPSPKSRSQALPRLLSLINPRPLTSTPLPHPASVYLRGALFFRLYLRAVFDTSLDCFIAGFMCLPWLMFLNSYIFDVILLTPRSILCLLERVFSELDDTTQALHICLFARYA